jgi:hypothetical protein
MTRPRPTNATARNTPERDELQLLTEADVSALLSVPLQTLRNARSRRAGGFGSLPFVRLGRSVRYRRADVERFIAGAMVNAGGN